MTCAGVLESLWDPVRLTIVGGKEPRRHRRRLGGRSKGAPVYLRVKFRFSLVAAS